MTMWHMKFLTGQNQANFKPARYRNRNEDAGKTCTNTELSSSKLWMHTKAKLHDLLRTGMRKYASCACTQRRHKYNLPATVPTDTRILLPCSMGKLDPEVCHGDEQCHDCTERVTEST